MNYFGLVSNTVVSTYQLALSTNTNFNSTTYFPITNTMTNSGIACAQFYCTNMNVGANFTLLGKTCWFDSTASAIVVGEVGGQAATGITGIRFKYASGNIASGTFTLYGVKTT